MRLAQPRRRLPPHLMARVYDRMLKFKVEYRPLTVQQYEVKYCQQQVKYL